MRDIRTTAAASAHLTLCNSMTASIQCSIKVVVPIVLLALPISAGDRPKRISISPTNDLCMLAVKVPKGFGFGSAVDGYNLSKAFETGHAIGSRNDYYGTRNILVIDDGKTTFPTIDKATGLPILILTDAKPTQELRDQVRGYNTAMRSAYANRKKAEPATRDIRR